MCCYRVGGRRTSLRRCVPVLSQAQAAGSPGAVGEAPPGSRSPGARGLAGRRLAGAARTSNTAAESEPLDSATLTWISAQTGACQGPQTSRARMLACVLRSAMETGFTVSGIGDTVRAQQRYVMNLRHITMRTIAGMALGHVMATIRYRRSARTAHVDGTSSPSPSRVIHRSVQAGSLRKVLRRKVRTSLPMPRRSGPRLCFTRCGPARPMARACRP